MIRTNNVCVMTGPFLFVYCLEGHYIHMWGGRNEVEHTLLSIGQLETKQNKSFLNGGAIKASPPLELNWKSELFQQIIKKSPKNIFFLMASHPPPPPPLVCTAIKIFGVFLGDK